jgi:hypothetical protein
LLLLLLFVVVVWQFGNLSCSAQAYAGGDTKIPKLSIARAITTSPERCNDLGPNLKD